MRRVDRRTNALPTNQPTNQPTNRPTDTVYYRDTRTHLTRVNEEKIRTKITENETKIETGFEMEPKTSTTGKKKAKEGDY